MWRGKLVQVLSIPAPARAWTVFQLVLTWHTPKMRRALAFGHAGGFKMHLRCDSGHAIGLPVRPPAGCFLLPKNTRVMLLAAHCFFYVAPSTQPNVTIDTDAA